jgi:hypothetical protein
MLWAFTNVAGYISKKYIKYAGIYYLYFRNKSSSAIAKVRPVASNKDTEKAVKNDIPDTYLLIYFIYNK